MKLRAVIFDFDGTLADSLGLALSVYNECAPGFGIPRIESADLARYRARSPLEIVAELGISGRKLPGLVHAIRAGMADRMGEVRVFPGIADLLTKLPAEGMRLGLLTSNSEANVRSVFASAGLAEPELRCCGVSLFGKGTRLRRLLRSSRLRPGEVCMVGDEARDITAAREVGTRAAGAGWGYGDHHTLASTRPDALATTPAELHAWLRLAG